MLFTAEKYVLENEIFALSTGSELRFRVVARNKGVFGSPYAGSLEGSTVFNRIGPLLPVSS